MEKIFNEIGLLPWLIPCLAFGGGALGGYSYHRLYHLSAEVTRKYEAVVTIAQKRMDLTRRLGHILQNYGHCGDYGVHSASLDVREKWDETNAAIGELASFAMKCPEVKADFAYQQLMNQIDHFTAELQLAGQEYIAVADTYNYTRRQLPAALFSRLLGFKAAPNMLEGSGE